MNKKIFLELASSPALSYPLFIGPGLLNSIAIWLPKNVSQVIIITDHKVKRRYGISLERALKKEGFETSLISFPAGEKSKTIQTKCKLEEKMLKKGCDRGSLIIALGGGVVGDLAGFIAATYMRGIDYIQIPTTLLAMLDSSVGGKTGIDTPQGKNLIGAFWQPKAVISDIHCLRTLPRKHRVNGLIEALKISLISDVTVLLYLEKNLEKIVMGDEKILTNFIFRAVNIKVKIVGDDEKETGKRAILNFGHTIGHAFEKISDYKLLHGYAVAYGILVEAKIAQLMGFLVSKDYERIKFFLKRLKISGGDLGKFKVDTMIKCTLSDKKKHQGAVHYVLLSGLGKVYEKSERFTHPVLNKVVIDAFTEVLKG